VKTNKGGESIMKKLLYLSILLVPIFLSINTVAGKAAPDPEEMKPHIINIAADFVQYWEQAKDLPMEEKIKLWDEMIENKHKDFYQQIIYALYYRQGKKNVREELLPKFLETVPDKIDLIKECAAEMEKEIVEVVGLLHEKYPDFKPIFDYYLAISLDQSDGGVRPFNKSVICYFGVDVATRIKSKVRRKALIAHENFHLYQMSKLMPKIMQKFGQMDMQQFMSKTGVTFMMFIEGHAVRATELVFPEAGLYSIYENLIPDIEEKMPQLAEQLLQNTESMSPEIYRKYFLSPNNDGFVPEKSGYYMGYLIVKDLEKEYSLTEMVKWDLDTLNQHMIKGLKKLKEGDR
jgi:hypothetical protein